MGRHAGISKMERMYTPSPLSTAMTAATLAFDVGDEEEEDPLDDLERAANTQYMPEMPVPESTPNAMSQHQESAPAPLTQSTCRVPKYWNATLPLKGETKEESEAAARRARTRALKKKSFIFELAQRNHTLCEGYMPIAGHGTPSLARDAGYLCIPVPCTEVICEMRDNGWPPEAALILFAREFFRRKLAGLKKELSAATGLRQTIKILKEIMRFSELECERSRQAELWSEEVY